MSLKQFIVFDVADQHYGVDIFGVDSIIRMQSVTVVPHAPGFVEGVTNLRGTVLPVVDLRRRFGLPARAPPKDTHIVVAEMEQADAGQGMLLAIRLAGFSSRTR